MGTWGVDNRLIISPNKSYKIPGNISYFKTRVTVSTYKPKISPKNCTFCRIVAQVYDVCPKINFFHKF